MEKCAESLLDCAEIESKLLNKAIDEANDLDPSETEQRLILARLLHRMRAPLLEHLSEFAPVPESRMIPCRCGNHLSLPDVLAEQTIDLSALFAEAETRRKNH
jgi:hypothetical protein